MVKDIKSIQAEKRVLGLFVEREDLLKKHIDSLEVDDFTLDDHRLLFRSLVLSLDKNLTSDHVFLLEELSLISQKNQNYWISLFSDLVLEQGLEGNIEKYIELLKEKKNSRNLHNTLVSSANSINKNDDNFSTLLGKVGSNILDIVKNQKSINFSTISDITKKYRKDLKKIEQGVAPEGLLLGWPSLDAKIGGLKGGQFIVIAARPSIGKTAFSLEIAKNVALNKHSVAYISLEMPADQLLTRIITSDSLLSSKIFLTPNHKMSTIKKIRLEKSIEKIANLPIFIDDSPTIKVGEIGWKSRNLMETRGLDLIIIDYLQLINSETKINENRQQVISEISRKLKSLARELNIPIIALSQLSRRVEQREDKRPQMSDIRESGAIEQDADIIMFLYREDYYDKSDSNLEKLPTSPLEVIISKHRNGPTGIVRLKFDLEYGKIIESVSLHETKN